MMLKRISFTLGLALLSCTAIRGAQTKNDIYGSWEGDNEYGEYSLRLHSNPETVETEIGNKKVRGHNVGEYIVSGEMCDSKYWFYPASLECDGNKVTVKYFDFNPDVAEEMTFWYLPEDDAIEAETGNIFLSRSNIEGNSAGTQGKYVTVTGHNVNIRKSAGNGSVVMKAPKGKTFTLKSVLEDWYEIDLGDGSSGYVSSRFARRSPVNSVSDRLYQIYPTDTSEEDGGVILYSYSFMPKGDYIAMGIYSSETNLRTGSIRSLGTDVYFGKRKGNEIVFSKKDYVLLADDEYLERTNPDELPDTTPFSAFYIGGGVAIDGKVLMEEQF